VAEPNRANVVNIDIKIGGEEVADSEVISFVIECDLDQPDMAVITLNNAGHHQTMKASIAQGKPVEVSVQDPPKIIFKGEVVGIEPIYKAGSQNLCVVRAFNSMHRMLRGRKSKTFQGPKVKDIITKICQSYSLTVDAGPEADAEVKHLYQHNQSDLEFVRQQAARLGCSVWVDDKKLFFKKPDLSSDSGIKFLLSTDAGEEGHQLKWFSPRMSSAQVVKEVTVRAWDPEQKKEVTGTATAAKSKLGKTQAAEAAKAAGGDAVTFVVDQPVSSPADAKKIAEAKLEEHMLTYITGEAGAVGKPDYKPGTVITIIVNKEQETDKFNGKYLVTGCTHKFSRAAGQQQGGYDTIFRVSRNAEIADPKP
jgi:phage protein D